MPEKSRKPGTEMESRTVTKANFGYLMHSEQTARNELSSGVSERFSHAFVARTTTTSPHFVAALLFRFSRGP